MALPEITQGDTGGRFTATLTEDLAAKSASAVEFEIWHRHTGVVRSVAGTIDAAATGITSFAIAAVSDLPVGVYLPTAIVTFPAGVDHYPCSEFRIKLGYDGRQ